MNAVNEKFLLPLDVICKNVTEQLPQSEYLIERHSILKGDTYSELSLSAKWLFEHETLSIELIFLVNKEKKQEMQAYIDDDDIRDDIDSAVGELFEDALQSTYPEHDWSYPIGEIKIKCKKI